jgi:hypothetical protein
MNHCRLVPNLPCTAQELGTRLNIPDLRGRISHFLSILFRHQRGQ